MKQILNAFFFALSYFTIIPIFVKDMKINNDTYKYTLAFLPLVGGILAIIVIALNIFLNEFFNPLYSAFVASVIYLALYGFLHLEAICDVVDAWFASYSGKDPYEIMKDPTIGAIGSLYAFCFVLLKVAISTYILFEEEYALFFTVLVFSRLNLMYLLQFFQFNKNSFLSLAFQSAGVGKLKIYTLIYLLIAMFIFSNAITLFILSLLIFYSIMKILNKKFSFVNGDCLGFTIEHSELILFNIALAIVL